MAQSILVTLSFAELDAGPFDLYSNADGYVTPIATGVSKATLLAGYVISVPDAATIIKVQSTGLCTNSKLFTISLTTTTTIYIPPTTTTQFPTTTTQFPTTTTQFPTTTTQFPTTTTIYTPTTTTTPTTTAPPLAWECLGNPLGCVFVGTGGSYISYAQCIGDGCGTGGTS